PVAAADGARGEVNTRARCRQREQGSLRPLHKCTSFLSGGESGRTDAVHSCLIPVRAAVQIPLICSEQDEGQRGCQKAGKVAGSYYERVGTGVRTPARNLGAQDGAVRPHSNTIFRNFSLPTCS